MAKQPKRTPAFDAGQMAFTFDPLPPTASAGSLAGFEKQIASAVSLMLKDDQRTRNLVAAGVSDLLDDEVSKQMLDAYCSEAKDTHNISFGRMLALVAETGRYDVLNGLLSRIGARLVVGEEVLTVELGHLEAQRQQIAERIATLRKVALPISTNGCARR